MWLYKGNYWCLFIRFGKMGKSMIHIKIYDPHKIE